MVLSPPVLPAYRRLFSRGIAPWQPGSVMRVLLLRVGALSALVVLGWIAIANAQRDGNSATDQNTSLAVTGEGSQNVNPLRQESPSRPDASSAGSTDRSVNPLRGGDPFGLQSQRNAPPQPVDSIPDASAIGLSAQRNQESPARYAQETRLASAEQPASGPALTAVGDSRPLGDRYTKPSQPAADRGAERYAQPPASGGQEPAPFKADPFAVPANPIRDAQPDRLALNTSTDASRVSAFATQADGVGQPGAPQLEGAQSPQLTIQKTAPKEIQVGKPATFSVTVRNTGQVPASDVEVHDVVPRGTRLLGTIPQAAHGGQGEVVWKLGTIRPGEEATAKMQLMPTAEGEIGSVATVHFGADASARCVATRPQLAVELAGPEKVLIGEQAVLRITVSNPGTGVATGVMLDERVPPGLQHPAGAELEYEVGDLKPGETKSSTCRLWPTRPGPATNVLRARAKAISRPRSG